MKLSFSIPSMDFSAAGKASTEVKRLLARLGLNADLVKRIAIAMYEGEMNIAIHGGGGAAEMELSPDKVGITLIDHGPGIADIDLAMTEGFSTASEEVRNMGFGAGMGLPNMKRNADLMEIESKVGLGTKVHLVFKLNPAQGA
ncbi:MAG TPA: ATP-binding protein [Rectinemataceae bacterium]|nr:ATP-binding protein [Rectinemataceae bacterium]